MGLFRSKLLAPALCLLTGTGFAAPLPQMRVCTSAGILYDIHPLTSAAESPRPTGLGNVVGIETDATGRLFSLTSFAGNLPNTFYAVDDATGQPELIGTTGLSAIFEGDLTFNPQNGFFYGIQDAPQGLRRFFRIDPTTGNAVHLASLGNIGDFSGLTYGRDNRLYCIDIARDLLLELNPVTGTILSTTALSHELEGDVCGMDYDPVGQTIYVAGRIGAINAIFTLDPATGQLTQVGETGVSNISGLTIIPEPAMFIGLSLLGALAIRRSRCHP